MRTAFEHETQTQTLHSPDIPNLMQIEASLQLRSVEYKKEVLSMATLPLYLTQMLAQSATGTSLMPKEQEQHNKTSSTESC